MNQKQDPKPKLDPKTIQTNIDYYHSQLDLLDHKRDLIKEQLDYWRDQLKDLE